MAILNIVKEGDEALRKICRPVDEISPRILRLLDDMLDTLHKANGVGLAAPQIGILRRYCVIDIGEGIVELINPVIIETEGEQKVGFVKSVLNRFRFKKNNGKESEK